MGVVWNPKWKESRKPHPRFTYVWANVERVGDCWTRSSTRTWVRREHIEPTFGPGVICK